MATSIRTRSTKKSEDNESTTIMSRSTRSKATAVPKPSAANRPHSTQEKATAPSGGSVRSRGTSLRDTKSKSVSDYMREVNTTLRDLSGGTTRGIDASIAHCSDALKGLRTLVHNCSGNISISGVDVEKAACSFVGKLVDLKYYREAMQELCLIRNGLMLCLGSQEAQRVPEVREGSLLSMSSVYSVPCRLESLAATPEPDTVVVLVLLMQQYVLGCIYKEDPSLSTAQEKDKTIAALLTEKGTSLEWIEAYHELKSSSETQVHAPTQLKIDGILSSLFGILFRGSRAKITKSSSPETAFTIKSVAILLYAHVLSLSPSKCVALCDQARKIIVAFATENNNTEPAFLQGKVRWFFKKFEAAMDAKALDKNLPNWKTLLKLVDSLIPEQRSSYDSGNTPVEDNIGEVTKSISQLKLTSNGGSGPDLFTKVDQLYAELSDAIVDNAERIESLLQRTHCTSPKDRKQIEEYSVALHQFLHDNNAGTLAEHLDYFRSMPEAHIRMAYLVLDASDPNTCLLSIGFLQNVESVLSFTRSRAISLKYWENLGHVATAYYNIGGVLYNSKAYKDATIFFKQSCVISSQLIEHEKSHTETKNRASRLQSLNDMCLKRYHLLAMSSYASGDCRSSSFYYLQAASFVNCGATGEQYADDIKCLAKQETKVYGLVEKAVRISLKYNEADAKSILADVIERNGASPISLLITRFYLDIIQKLSPSQSTLAAEQTAVLATSHLFINARPVLRVKFLLLELKAIAFATDNHKYVRRSNHEIEMELTGLLDMEELALFRSELSTEFYVLSAFCDFRKGKKSDAQLRQKVADKLLHSLEHLNSIFDRSDSISHVFCGNEDKMPSFYGFADFVQVLELGIYLAGEIGAQNIRWQLFRHFLPLYSEAGKLYSDKYISMVFSYVFEATFLCDYGLAFPNLASNISKYVSGIDTARVKLSLLSLALLRLLLVRSFMLDTKKENAKKDADETASKIQHIYEACSGQDRVLTDSETAFIQGLTYLELSSYDFNHAAGTRSIPSALKALQYLKQGFSLSFRTLAGLYKKSSKHTDRKFYDMPVTHTVNFAWAVLNAFSTAMIYTSQLYMIRGNAKSAEHFARQASNLTTEVGNFQIVQDSLLLIIETQINSDQAQAAGLTLEKLTFTQDPGMSAPNMHVILQYYRSKIEFMSGSRRELKGHQGLPDTIDGSSTHTCSCLCHHSPVVMFLSLSEPGLHLRELIDKRPKYNYSYLGDSPFTTIKNEALYNLIQIAQCLYQLEESATNKPSHSLFDSVASLPYPFAKDISKVFEKLNFNETLALLDNVSFFLRKNHARIESYLVKSLLMAHACLSFYCAGISSKDVKTPPHLLDSSLSVSLYRDLKEVDAPPIQDVQSFTFPSVLTDEGLSTPCLSTLDTTPIPERWIVVSLFLDQSDGCFIMSRRSANGKTLTAKFPLISEGKKPFDDIIKEMKKITEGADRTSQSAKDMQTKEDCRNWWRERNEYDYRLETLLFELETQWLGIFRTFFLLDHNHATDDFQSFKSKIRKILIEANLSPDDIDLDDSCFDILSKIDGSTIDAEQWLDWIYKALSITGVSENMDKKDEVLKQLVTAVGSFRDAQSSSKVAPDHVVLLLDDDLHMLPWESIPSLLGVSCSRLPSSVLLADRLVAFNSSLNGGIYEVKHAKASFLTNPSGDLVRTEKRFSPWLEQMVQNNHWSKISSSDPQEKDIASSLSTDDLFIYFGHGGCEQYIRSQTVRGIRSSATVMLWGCSSGKLKKQGVYPPTGTVLNYLVAGCPAVVVNLWDVTDKDIDTFAASVFSSTGLDSVTDAAAISVTEAVAKSRAACHLKYLNGAAPVVYGIPVLFH